MKNIILALTLLPLAAMAKAPIVTEGFFVLDAKKELIHTIKNHGDLVIDHIDESGYEVYGPKGLGKWLTKDVEASILPITQDSQSNKSTLSKDKGVYDYPSSSAIGDQLTALAAKHPHIFKLSIIGYSHNSQPLYLMKISDNVGKDELEPEVKYIANMHGDEIVGREMMVRLIKYIGKKYDSGDTRIESLVNNTEVFIIPSMNPDGADKRRRGNGRSRDLNRDFPDFTTRDNQNNSSGRQPETKAVMTFQKSRNFALSANFHGGTTCVNYPWDTSGEEFPLKDLIIDLSLKYASDVPEMRNSTRFESGITNGYKWYEVDGGMQDWSYNWHDDLQVTIEVSNTKWPKYSSNDQYFLDNRESLIRYLETVHRGAGIKLPAGVEKAQVTITKLGVEEKTKSIGTYSANNGEYYKVLPPGNYEFSVKMGIRTKVVNLSVRKDVISRGENYIKL